MKKSPSVILGIAKNLLQVDVALLAETLHFVQGDNAGFFNSPVFPDFPELEQAGYRIERTVSTLFLGPGECDRAEEPPEGYVPGASFINIVARAAQSLD